MTRQVAFSILLIFFLASCGRVNKQISITAYTPGSDSHNAALALKEVLEDEGWDISVVSMTHIEGAEALRNGKADLAITSNDISMDPNGLRTIIPLYHEVLTILIREDSPIRKVRSLSEVRELLKTEKPRILFSYQGSYAHRLAQRLLDTQGIYANQYESYHFPESGSEFSGRLEIVEKFKPDAIYLVGSEDNTLVHELIQMGYKFNDSSDELENIEASSTMSYANKMARCFPAVVPKYAFSIYQEHPILTLGIYTSLVASKEMTDATAYELAREIVNSFPHLVTTNASFVDLKENFDRKLLNYKLHPGSRNYFDRDKPSFFERYAELSGVVLSMFVVFVTFLAWMNRVIRQRKKNRIDVFYAEAEKIRHVTDYSIGLKELASLQDKAFGQLIDEKLSADESFIVFMQLVAEIKDELKEKLTSQ